MDRSDGLNWVCGQMIRIEENWTKQVQDQQTRINSVMAVNGFLLAFLAATGFAVAKQVGKGWYLYPYYLSLILLCVALLFGLGAFVPRTPFADLPTLEPSSEHEKPLSDHDTYWLDSRAVWNDYQDRVNSDELDELVRRVAKSAGMNQCWNRKIRNSLETRRLYLYRQMICLGLATLFLIGAIVGIADKVIPS